MEDLQMSMIGEKVNCSRPCYFFDCGEVAQTISKIYGKIMPISGFISDDSNLQGKSINNIKVYSLEEVLKDKQNYIVVATNSAIKSIFTRLENLGLTPEKDFCHYKEWIRKYFEAYLRDNGKLLQDYLELYITDRCSLSCKACILFAPYAKKPHQDRDFELVKRDIETYFKFVDKVSVFRLMGGEPFLYRQIEELLHFIIDEGYRDLMESMIVVSNGTIIPPQKILKILSENNIEVHVSDYPVEIAQKQRAKLIEAFESENVKYKIKSMRWVDVHSNPEVIKHKTKQELTDLFQECFVRCRTMYEGKLYFCAIDAAAQRRGYIKGSADDFIDLLSSEDKQKIKEKILDLDAGKIGKGYVSFCRNCWGGTDSNNRIIPIAEQL